MQIPMRSGKSGVWLAVKPHDTKEYYKKITKLQKSEQNKNIGFIACQASEHRQFNRWDNLPEHERIRKYTRRNHSAKN